MVFYVVTQWQCADQTRYGIAAVEGDRLVDQLDDVALTQEETIRLAARLQQGGVSAEHFRDIVEDQIAYGLT